MLTAILRLFQRDALLLKVKYGQFTGNLVVNYQYITGNLR